MLESVWFGRKRHYLFGLCLGSLGLGLIVTPLSVAVGLVGRVPRIGAGTALVSVLLALEVGGVGAKLPQNRRLVPQTVMGRGDTVGPIQFGFEMGLGFRTYVTTSLALAALIMAVVVGGGAPATFLTAIGFGLGRAAMVPARAIGPDSWDGLIRSWTRFQLPIVVAFAACLAVLLRSL